MELFKRSPAAGTIAVSVLVGVGITALINGALARGAERRNPPKGKFIEIDGVRLHYVEKGAGSPVVLLHGNQTMAEDFEISGVFDVVAENHHVIAFDRPGLATASVHERWYGPHQHRRI